MFGPFRFDAVNGFLYKDEARLALPPRATGVLAVLLARPGQVVSKQALLDEVWKDTHVTDTSLAEAVSLLRQALGDDPQRGDYIQTIPRRGYRFAAPLEAPVAPAPTSLEGDEARDDDRPLWTPWLPWVLAVAGGILGTSVLWSLRSGPPARRETIARFAIAMPDSFQVAAGVPALAFAPDASAIAFVAEQSGQPRRLFVRSLADPASRELAGTDGAEAPFFSPDARSIGYFARGRLFRIDVDGGEPLALADAPAPGGGAWGEDGAIVFGARWGEGLVRIAAAGGAVRAITTLDAGNGDARHAWPCLEPSTGLVLYAGEPAVGDERGPHVFGRSQGTLRTSMLADHATLPGLLPAGELIVWRGGRAIAARVDARTLIHDREVPLPLAVSRTPSGAPLFALSSRGAAVSVPLAADGTALSWVTPDGRSADGPWPHTLTPLVLEADGEHLVAETVDPGAPRYWRISLARGTQVQLQTPPALATGGLVATVVADRDHGLDIVARRTGAGEPVARVSTPADDAAPAISPDGSMLAWESRSGGLSQIAVAPIARLADQGATQIVASGHGPFWSRDGATLWFVHEGTLMASAIERASGGTTPARMVAGGIERILGTAPDGRVLVVRQRRPVLAVDVVLGWAEEVRARLAKDPTLPRSFR